MLYIFGFALQVDGSQGVLRGGGGGGGRGRTHEDLD